MSSTLRLFLCLVLLVLSGSPRLLTTPAQAPAELIARFAALTTADARAAMLKEHPVLAEPASRTALSQHADDLRQSNLPAAYAAYNSLLWLGRTLKDDRTIVPGLTGLGIVEAQRGDLLTGTKLLLQAQQVAEPLNDPSALQPALANLAITYRRLGDLDAAEASANHALSLALAMKRQEPESRVYNTLGLIAAGRGQLTTALDYFTRSLELKEDDGGRGTREIANTLSNMGALYSEVGDYDQAHVYFQRALKTVDRPGAEWESSTATQLSNAGNALLVLGKRVEARAAFDRALALAERAKDGLTYTAVLYNMGNLSRDEGRLDDAIDFHRRALEIRAQGGNRLSQIESLSELTRLMLARGAVDEASALVNQSLALAEAAGVPAGVARAQVFRGEVLEAQGRPDEALAAYEAAIQAVEMLRDQAIGGSQGRQVFLSWRLAPYLGVAALHAKAGRGFDALLSIERARARTLLDIMSVGRPVARSLTADEQVRERTLDAAVVSASTLLTTARGARVPNQARVAQLEAALAAARRERQTFLDQLEAARPDLKLARGAAPLLSRDHLTTLLPAGTAVAEFVIEPARTWVYLIKAGPDGPDIRVHGLSADANTLTALADRFADQVATRDLGFNATSRQLYATLFGPHEAWLEGVRHLILVPDGALWRVPFQALQSARGQYLIERTAVSYTPSLSALDVLRSRQQQRSRTAAPFLLALGDPDLATASAPTRLPEAVREVEAIGRLYGRGRSAVFVGANASESALRANISRAQVVHVATHGVLEDVSPMYSHLVLAGDDGRLDARELVALDIPAELVVLSACETARGKVGGGEGIIGLSWSLFAAGASTAVVSQWAVDSASTTTLMIGFHGQLLGRGGSRLTAPHALRASALAIMRDPRYRHPFYWAGFIAIGA